MLATQPAISASRQDSDEDDDVLAEELQCMVEAESVPGSVQKRVGRKSPSHFAVAEVA